MPFDALGNFISDDEQMSLDAMKYELAKRGSMPLRPDGSDVPYVASQVPNIRVPVTPKEPPKPYSTATNIPQAIADRLGITAIPQALMAMATDLPAAVAKETGYKDIAKAIQYEPSSRMANQMLEVAEQAPRVITGSHMGFGPLAETWTPMARGISSDDVRVMGKRAIETGREIRAIPEDFANAQSGVTRLNAYNEPTYGARLQSIAEDIGDVTARRQAMGKSSLAGIPEGFVEVFDPKLYAVRNLGEGQMLRPTETKGGVRPENVTYGETEEVLRSLAPELSVNRPEAIIESYEQLYMSGDSPTARSLQAQWDNFFETKAKEMYPPEFTGREALRSLYRNYPENEVKDMKLKWFYDFVNESRAQGFNIPSMEEYFARAQGANLLTRKIVPNIVQKYMGTPQDPFLESAKEGVTVTPAEQLAEFEKPTMDLMFGRKAAGFEQKGEIADKLMPIAESKLATQNQELDTMIAEQAEIGRTEGMLVPYPDGRIDPNTGQVAMANNPNYAQYSNKIGAMRKAIEDTEEEIRKLRIAQAYENVSDASLNMMSAESARQNIPRAEQGFYPQLFEPKPRVAPISPTEYKTPAEAKFFEVSPTGFSKAGMKDLTEYLVDEIMQGRIPPDQIPTLSQPHTIRKYMKGMVAPRLEKEKAARLAMKDYKANVVNHFVEVLNTIPDSMRVGTNAKLLWIDDATPEAEINQHLSDETFVLDHCIGNSGNGRGLKNLFTGDDRQYIPLMDPATKQKFKGASSTSSYMDAVAQGDKDIMMIRDDKTGMPVGTIELNKQAVGDGSNEYSIGYVSGYKNHSNPHDGIDSKYREALRDALNMVKDEITSSDGNEARSGVYDLNDNDQLNRLKNKLSLPSRSNQEKSRAWAGVQKNIKDTIGTDRFITLEQAEEALKQYKAENPPVPAVSSGFPPAGKDIVERNIIMQGLSRNNLDTERQFNAARMVAYGNNRFSTLPLIPDRIQPRPLEAYRRILSSIERRAEQNDLSDYQVFRELQDYADQMNDGSLRFGDFNLGGGAELVELMDTVQKHADAVGQLAHYADVLQRNGYRSPLPSDNINAPEWQTYQRYIGELGLDNPSDLRTRLRDTIEHGDIREIDPQLDEIQRANFRHLLEIHIRALEQAEHYPAPTTPAQQRGIPLEQWNGLVNSTLDRIQNVHGNDVRQTVAQILSEAISSQMDVAVNERPAQVSNFLGNVRLVNGSQQVRNALRTLESAIDQANADIQNARNAPQTSALPDSTAFASAINGARGTMTPAVWSDALNILEEINQEVRDAGGLPHQQPATIVNRLREQAELQDVGGEPDTAVGLRNLAVEIARLVPANPPASMALQNARPRTLVAGQEALSNSILDVLHEDRTLEVNISDRLNALEWRRNLVDDPAGLVRNIRIEADAEALAGNERLASKFYDIANLIADENGQTMFTPARMQAVAPAQNGAPTLTPRDVALQTAEATNQTTAQRQRQIDALTNSINNEIRDLPNDRARLTRALDFYTDYDNLPTDLMNLLPRQEDAERILSYIRQHIEHRLVNLNRQTQQNDVNGYFDRINHIIDDTILTINNNPRYADMQNLPSVLEREINGLHQNSENLPQFIQYLRDDLDSVVTNHAGDEFHDRYADEIRHLIDRLESVTVDLPQLVNQPFHQQPEPAPALPAPAQTADFPDTEQFRTLARMNTNSFTGAQDAFYRIGRNLRAMSMQDRLNLLNRQIAETGRDAENDEGQRAAYGVDSPAGMGQLNAALRALRTDLQDRNLLNQLQAPAPVDNDIQQMRLIEDAIDNRILRVNQNHLGISQQFDSIVQAARREFNPLVDTVNFVSSLYHRANSVDRVGDREAIVLSNMLRGLADDVNNVLARETNDPIRLELNRAFDIASESIRTRHPMMIEEVMRSPNTRANLADVIRADPMRYGLQDYSEDVVNHVAERLITDGLSNGARQLPAPDPVAQHFDRVEQGVTQPEGLGALNLNDQEVVRRLAAQTIAGQNINAGYVMPVQREMANVLFGSGEATGNALPAVEHIRLIRTLTSETYNPATDGESLIRLLEQRAGMFANLEPFQSQEGINIVNNWNSLRFPNYRPPEEGMGLEPEGRKRGGFIRKRKMNEGGDVPKLTPYEQFKIDNAERIRQGQEDLANRNKYDPYKGSGRPIPTQKENLPRRASGSAGVMPSGSGPSYLDKPSLYAIGGRVYMEIGGGVKPVPNVPATPEKTRPNTTDHVIRKPADKGFPEILERIRNTPKPSGSAGAMPSGSGPSSLDKPSLYSGGGKAGQRFHPLVEKGIAEGRIDVADASWLSDYANTPGSSKVGTGSSSMPDQSQRMENFLSRVKSGEVQNPYPAEQRQPISKDLTGSSSFTREQLREQALSDQALNPRVGGGGGGADLERGMTGSRFKKPSYENGGNVNIDAMRLALMKG